MSTMKFCPECNNLLYPNEDKREKILYFECRTCDHREVAENNCVYKNVIEQDASDWEQTHILPDLVEDPTYPRTRGILCDRCGHREAVVYRAFHPQGQGWTVFLICCNRSCRHWWKDTENH